jgi:hypothetical protein
MDKFNMNTVTVQCGVDYATVESRVRAFCSEHQNGQILTEMVKCEDDTGEVVFKAHAVVDGVIRGTGHSMEVRGSSNINKTSHVEVCETSAVGRALAMMGYMSKGQIASYEEIENAKLQRSEIKKHEKAFMHTVVLLSAEFKEAINNDDEENILKVLKEMRGNQPLRKAVNATLSNEQVQYLSDRQAKITDAYRKNYAKEFVKKQLNG